MSTTVSSRSQCPFSTLSVKGMKPYDCPAFGAACTPRTPLGATMVSAEGACAAYYQFGRRGKGAA